ncbi:hypothetical protein PSU4_55050 [Pseudonocardia sulfidoxydans NBRC 16205]|uniref:Uncharacterized protein n=1 Tax=Pseudonocardia sulfidoxydans NBRC 16205 TaxID=1223511 RepID=A0A511DP04_9PSEU|nr:hypothetical protein [Pseudonocardia sulfidoxydans]GEL26551.1 hypothetical protein PSU4_55050 [Pseudonocardia sulfidoxydans NBRC 16205]
MSGSDPSHDVDLTGAVAAAGAAATMEDTCPPPEQVRDLLAAAVRLYARSDELGELAEPIDGTQVTATEAVTVVAALMRAQHLNPFDLQLWLDRTPDGR